MILGRLAPTKAAKQALHLFMITPKSQRGPRENEFWDSGKPMALPSGLDARSFGDPENPDVWIVHGWGSRSSHLRNIIESLTIQNYHVVAWDGPAHGRNPQKTTNMLQFAMILQQDISVAGKPEVSLIGHSFGAGACAYLASTHPQIKKLVTIGVPTDIRQVVINFWKRIGLPQKAQTAFLNEVEQTLGITPLELSIIHFYPQVKIPWLLVHDEQDEDVSFKGIEKLMSLKPPIQFLITENLGHYRILKNTWVITKIVSFLQSGTIK